MRCYRYAGRIQVMLINMYVFLAGCQHQVLNGRLCEKKTVSQYKSRPYIL